MINYVVASSIRTTNNLNMDKDKKALKAYCVRNQTTKIPIRFEERESAKKIRHEKIIQLHQQKIDICKLDENKRIEINMQIYAQKEMDRIERINNTNIVTFKPVSLTHRLYECDYISHLTHKKTKNNEPKYRNTLENKEWRESVFEQDNYTCQYCGKRGGKIEGHHLNSYANYPDERYDIENGKTLCKKCHKDFHHQFGNNVTKEQYTKYINNDSNRI